MRPDTETAVAEMIRDADGPLRIVGGGTRGADGPGARLETGGLSGVTLYEPGALTLVARAGTSLAEVEATLAAEGQRLPFEPWDACGLLHTEGLSTIGGVVATNASGPRRIQAGACRDSLIGVRFVDGSGTVIKNGGRVMKNVTGYDLVKLMAGSRGTLGVLTEVSFKVLPATETVACLRIDGLDVAQAVAAMSRALGSPFEVSGAAHVPAGGGITMLRVEGFADSVAYRAERLRELLAEFGTTRVESDPAQVAESWRDLRDAAGLQGADGDLWRISIKPSDAPAVAAALPGATLLYDWGGGLIWAAVAKGFDLRAALPVAGHATCLRGDAPVTHPEPEPLARISAGLRSQFDPRGILNPGLMA